MGQKETIVDLLKTNGTMTQLALAEAIYGDKNHGPNIYSALMGLVNSGAVLRTGSQPAYYSLSGADIVIPEKVTQPKKGVRDVSGDEITNSTHLSQHKSKISMVELSSIIASIPDIDARIKAGDPEVVNLIARSNGKINLFSFASKYCCYHNRNLYERDDYSILDTVLKDYLPRYFGDVTRNQIQRWQDSFNYKAYNDYITKKLDELGITVEFRKRKFDLFVWYKNR